MAYMDELLGRGEEILHIGRQHLFVLISHVLTEMVLIGLLVAAGVASNVAFQSNTPLAFGMTANTLILLICILISIVVLISGFIDYIRWNTEQYVITDRRVIQIRGIVNKQVVDSSLEKINDLELRQSFLGRIFNFGTLEILTASGDDGSNIIDSIGDPVEFKRQLLEAKHRYSRGYNNYSNAPQSQPAPAQYDIQRMLEDLAALRDRGILSPEEFEAKKRELLSRI